MRTDFDRNLEARHAQSAWSARGIAERLKILGRARGILARMTHDLVEAMPSRLARTPADTLAAEVLPLLAAGRFLETDAARILKTRRLGRRGLPFWLAGVDSRIERVPFGIVLIIGPSNYPLFLPGVQTLQALTAGNAVVWKPGEGGRAVAEVFAAALDRAGLPVGLLRVTEESVQAAETELYAGPDKIFFTGSATAAQRVLAAAAKTLTPCVIEASGCDAVVVLPSADASRVLEAIVFGMRLNGSATCMAPRRLLLVGDAHESLVPKLRERFAAMDGVVLPDRTRRQLRALLAEARDGGAEVHGDLDAVFTRPLLVTGGRAAMGIAQADLFAPVLTVICCANADAVLEAQRTCPFALTVAIFGAEPEARQLGNRIKAGTLLIDDLIVPTVDPRVPFGGRRGSGFGVTRGAEGLLEMTAIKAVLTRRGSNIRHYAATSAQHRSLLEAVIALSHAPAWRERLAGLRGTIDAARKLK
jgi:acyl-CoA reductase-like NAD-dependent aldehyde dehydrogenase